MSGATVWAGLIVVSALIGGACGFVPGEARSRWLAMGVPWFGLLAILMYGCSQGGVGWQFWPIAQIFGGGVAAAAGGVSAELVRRWRSRRRGMRAGG